jgi:hypothetical protein
MNTGTRSLYGFTLLRNGLKYDYPFRESLQSLSQLCEETVVALGKSEDGTEEALAGMGRLAIVPTVWNEELRKSGLILSEQTNIALEALRTRHPSGWGIYLQADEVLNPADFPRLRADLARAEGEGCDAVSFRYLHFWQSYDRIAISPRWYPHEIRAVLLESGARSYGDAQSFQGTKKVFFTDVPVFHYGHVRKPEAYERKKTDFHRWWHSDAELAKVVAKGEKREKKEKVLRYLGPHPAMMAERMASMPSAPAKAPPGEVLIFGRESALPEGFTQRVQAKVRFTNNRKELAAADPAHTVLLEKLPFLARLRSLGRFQSKVPEAMGSPQARLWPAEFRALLLLSEKGVAVH